MKRITGAIAATVAVAVAPALAAPATASAEGIPCSVLFHHPFDPVAWDGTWRNILHLSPWGTDRIFCEKTSDRTFRAWQLEPNGTPHNLVYLGGSIPAYWYYQP